MKNDYFNTLEKEDIDIRKELELDIKHSSIFADIETWFDVDKKFGINTADNDDVWVNLYAYYHPFINDIKIFYSIDTEDGIFTREYLPMKEEKQMFINRIEQACEQQNTMSCKEFFVREYAENHTDDLKLVCEDIDDKMQIRNAEDNFILYYSDNIDERRFIGDEIELANYRDGECYSIESVDEYEVIYSTDAPEQNITEFEERNIDKDTFWQMIDESRELCGKFSKKMAGILQKKLENCSVDNVKKFCGIYYLYHDAADKDGIADIANTMTGGMLTDDGFIDFRAWLIAQGKETYIKAMKNPDILAEKAENKIDGLYYFETFGYVGMKAVEKLTGDFKQAFEELPKDEKKDILKEIEYGEYTKGEMTVEEIEKAFPKFAEKYIEIDNGIEEENEFEQTMG